MNILFLNPPFLGRFSRTSRSPAITKGGTLYYPIWLAYATGYAEQAGHDVRLVDAPADGLELLQVFERLEDFVPGLVVVDTSTPSIFSDLEVARLIKERYPDTFMLVVGTHPSAVPEETLSQEPTVDGAALGEYDQTIRDLAEALEASAPLTKIPGLCLRLNDELIRTPPREKNNNLSAIPPVASVYKKHLNIKNYFFAAANYPMVQIITGRGCPFKCFFCVYPQTFHSRRYRPRNPEEVVAEFEFIVREMPEVREIGIEDDCFTANPGHVRRICELLIERGIRIPWYCNVRGDVGLELLQLMRTAGCRLVTVGFESGSQAVLDNINKGETVDRYLQFAKDAKRARMLVHGCIMAGNPGDTPETLEESYRFALKVNCDSMQFYPLYVYPGTEAYDWALENDYLSTTDYSRWVDEEGLHNCVLNTPALSAKTLVELCDLYVRKYHLRPSYLARKLLQAVLHPGEGYRSLKSGKVFLTKIISGLWN